MRALGWMDFWHRGNEHFTYAERRRLGRKAAGGGRICTVACRL